MSRVRGSPPTSRRDSLGVVRAGVDGEKRWFEVAAVTMYLLVSKLNKESKKTYL